MEKFTLIELKLISEILEFRFYDMFMSHNKRDKNVKISDFKTLGKHHFPDIRFKELIEKGFVTHIKCKTFFHHADYFSINFKTLEKFVKEINEFIYYVPKEKRDLSYTKRRINFYCKYYGYNFGSDNANHVISGYIEKCNGHYISHTTKDCVMTFYGELMKHKQEIFEIYGKG